MGILVNFGCCISGKHVNFISKKYIYISFPINRIVSLDKLFESIQFFIPRCRCRARSVLLKVHFCILLHTAEACTIVCIDILGLTILKNVEMLE